MRRAYNETCLTVRKAGKKYVVDNNDDMPLTKRELVKLFTQEFPRGLEVAPEELAFMFDDFKARPENNEAHFGLAVTFMFTVRRNAR